ncbi:MAG TPA: DUF3592 domain-containing protein [Verrucomicrobiae bacterium]|nr:DUF3592 domain-containing protein [Verrucomicrobiae bacterium]
MSTHAAPGRSRQQIAARVMFWVAIFLMLILPLWLFLHAFNEAQRQHRIVSTYQPVKATVLSSEVHRWEDSDHDVQYDPQIHYQYSTPDGTHLSDQLAPVSLSGSRAWAEAMVRRYPAGAKCDAFFDPANPSQAVLLLRYSFDPYKDMLQGAFILTSGCFVVVYLWYAGRRKIAPADGGWFAIAAESGERQRLVRAKACTAAWYLTGAVPAIHYFLCVPPPYSDRAIGIFAVFVVLGMIPILFLVRYGWMNRNMDEARFLVDRAEGILGERLRFTVSQLVRRPLQLKQATVRVRCIGVKRHGNSSSRTVLFETTPAELKAGPLHAGEELALSGEITLPATQPPSGRDPSDKYDWIVWKMLWQCQLLRAPDYATEYDFPVKARPVESPEPAVRPTTTAEVRVIEPEFAGRVMSKRGLVIGVLISVIPNVIQLAGVGFAVAMFTILYPDKNDPQPFWDLPKPEAHLILGISIAVVVVASLWGLVFPGALRNRYFRAVIKGEIRRRRDAIVEPGAGSQFVEIVPRENWNRTMWRTEKDMGFLVVDADRREIRFEGDKERYRIPVDALVSCDVEKSALSSAAKSKAPGYFMVVLRAATASGMWEAPVAPLVASSLFRSKARRRAAEALQARIQSLAPASLPAGKHRKEKATPA